MKLLNSHYSNKYCILEDGSYEFTDYLFRIYTPGQNLISISLWLTSSKRFVKVSHFILGVSQ